jgi:hypothetical protein
MDDIPSGAQTPALAAGPKLQLNPSIELLLELL